MTSAGAPVYHLPSRQVPAPVIVAVRHGKRKQCDAVVYVSPDEDLPADIEALLICSAWFKGGALQPPPDSRVFESLEDVCEWAPAKGNDSIVAGPMPVLRAHRVHDDPEAPTRAPGTAHHPSHKSFEDGAPIIGVDIGVGSLPLPDPSFEDWMRRMRAQRRRWRAYLGEHQASRQSRRRRKPAYGSEEFEMYGMGGDATESSSESDANPAQRRRT